MKITKRSVLAAVVIATMSFCLCACGNDEGSTEETVEITTVAEDQQQEEDENQVSAYHKIYDEYAEKMESAAKGYKDDINAKADSLSKDDLYDLVKNKIDDLGKIREEGANKMTDAMLASTEDDQDTYEKWYSKLSDKFAELQRELSEIYTSKF